MKLSSVNNADAKVSIKSRLRSGGKTALTAQAVATKRQPLNQQHSSQASSESSNSRKNCGEKRKL